MQFCNYQKHLFFKLELGRSWMESLLETRIWRLEMSFRGHLREKVIRQYLHLRPVNKVKSKPQLGTVWIRIKYQMKLRLRTHCSVIQFWRVGVFVMWWLLLLIYHTLISWSRRRALWCKLSKNLLGYRIPLFHIVIKPLKTFDFLNYHFLKVCENRLLTTFSVFSYGQTRNARKACPNGVSLPEWILKSREIGTL